MEGVYCHWRPGYQHFVGQRHRHSEQQRGADLNGFAGGSAAGPGTLANGVFASNRQNITIKNGTIRGFSTGVFLGTTGASQGHVVEDIRVDQNTRVGIDVQGTGNIVRNNQVVSTGGSTTSGADADAYGIIVVGDGPRVLQRRDPHREAGGGLLWGFSSLLRPVAWR